MEKTRITITHNLEKIQYHFMVLNPNKLSTSEVEMIKLEMGVEMVFVNGKLYM